MSSRSTSPARQSSDTIVQGNAAATSTSSNITKKSHKSSASRRLGLTKSHLRATSNHRHDDRPNDMRWNPNWNHFPSRHSLQRIPGAPAGAAWFWGADDQLGRLNLLTPRRVLKAKDEIRTGEIVSVNLPLHEPDPPAFGSRLPFKHEIRDNANGISFDDTYSLNTQSGTQWDGFRHWSHLATKTFYNGTKPSDILGPQADAQKGSIHHWSQHGIAGRAVLLDFQSYAQRKGISYDPYGSYEITLDNLKACARHQRIDIRPSSAGGQIKIGDILLIRTGFTAHNRLLAPAEREKYGKRSREETSFSGLQASEEIVTWLHDCYFAAAASDSPAFEVWPPKRPSADSGFSSAASTSTGSGAAASSLLLHEHMLALWGMPIGELLDLEVLAQKCKQRDRWFFFFSSAPANVVGGVASHVNGQAIL